MSLRPRACMAGPILLVATIASVVGACSSELRGPRLYVTNEMSGDISVVDPVARALVATIPVGKRPRGVRISPDASTLYVALSGSPIGGPGVDEASLPPPDRRFDGIGVVDLRTGRLMKTLRGGSDPEQLAVSRDGGRLFIANEDAAEVTVLDVAAGQVISTIRVGGEPEGVDLSPDGKWVYVTSEEDNEVSVIATDTLDVVATVEVGARPRSTGFLLDSSRAYVSAENAAAVYVVDSRQHRLIGPVKLPDAAMKPMGVVAAPDRPHVYVSTGRGKAVVIIDTATNKPVASIEVGERPWGIAVSPDGKTLYTANGPSNDVSIVDVVNRTVVARVKVGERPWGLAVVP